MALSDVFLAPLGLLALLALVPLVVLYLVRPDPSTRRLPSVRFLTEERRQDTTNPLLERLRRNLLFLLQALVLILLAVSLATPYTPVSESQAVEETVVVLDTSASMATQTGGGTRFAAAVDGAETALTGTTSVVVTAPASRVLVRGGTRQEATASLSELQVTHAAGDLRGAISQASAIAGENARVVVFSDFAGDDAWVDAVRTARARGLRVELRQFDGGGADNVGIVSESFTGSEVTLSVRNFGDAPVERTLTLGDQQTTLSLAPGDVATATFTVPPGGDVARLSPSDSFPVDDAAYLAAPDDAKIDVLLLTNDRNRFLATALSVVDEVSLTVDSPPTSIDREYDVVVFGTVDRERLLRGTVDQARDALDGGGGVVVVGQENPPSVYGDLLLVEPQGVGTNPGVRVADDPLVRGIEFPPPEEYLVGSLSSGEAVVSATDGTPLVATEERGDGRVLYYGYLDDRTSFRYNYQYPVFWKRAVFWLSGRAPLPELNRETGARLRFSEPTTVETPDGEVTDAVVSMDRVGYYRTGSRAVGASLLSASESAVDAEPLSRRSDAAEVVAREEAQTVPRPLTDWVVLGALGVMVVELAYMKRRGDI
ncbi:MAG: VWA domain-containing protein [Haloferacaceae archaeon]